MVHRGGFKNEKLTTTLSSLTGFASEATKTLSFLTGFASEASKTVAFLLLLFINSNKLGLFDTFMLEILKS